MVRTDDGRAPAEAAIGPPLMRRAGRQRLKRTFRGRKKGMKSCLLKSVYGLLGIVFLFAAVMGFVSWLKDEPVANIHGNGLLIYIAIFLLLGLVGVWGAMTKWDQ
jgi:uncharacterized membrane protein